MFSFSRPPKIAEFFQVLDTQPAVADRPGARDAGRLAGGVAFENVTYSYDGERRKAVTNVSFSRKARRDNRARRLDRLGQIDDARPPASRLRSGRGRDHDRRRRHPRLHAASRFAAISAWCSRSRCCSPARSRKICASASRTRRDAEIDRALELAQASRFRLAPERRTQDAGRRTRPLAFRRRAPAPLHRPRLAQGPADPDFRRGDLSARRDHRTPDSEGARRRHARPHDLRHRPSSGHRAQRRPHSGVRSGRDRRERLLRVAGGQRRPLRDARVGAIHDRAHSVRRRRPRRRA